MTAPMKFDRSVTSPIVIASTSARNRSPIFFHSDAGT